MANPSWSYSKLTDFEKCKKLFWLKHDQKIPEPERPLPPGQSEHANDRGTRIHESCELYINGTNPTLAPEAELYFEHHIELLRAMYKDGLVSLEGEWGMDREWNVAEWKGAWLRLKLDAMVMHSPTHATVIDFKGLPLTTLIPTPSGWTTMGEIQVGDKLFDINGAMCEVLGKSEIKHLPNYRITFDDTSVVECDEEHLWTLHSNDVRAVTELVVGDLIATAGALQLPEQSLPIDPYVLGFWLADGKHSSGEVCKPDPEIWEEVRRRGYEIGNNYNEGTDRCRTHTIFGLRSKLDALGILGDKQIPQMYLRGSYRQRLDLLRGIFDGDGSANHKRKQAVLNTTRLDFAQQVQELLLSLGQRPLISPYKATGFGKTVDAYYVSFRPNGINPFSLPRKANKVLKTWGAGESWRRKITSIEKLAPQPTQCILVNSPSHTFLCTEKFIPTHNTGRKFGNEIKHGEQLALYQLVTFLRYPQLEHVTAELWYLDQKPGENITSASFTREKGLKYRSNFDRRGHKLTTCTDFPANPNVHSCKWCQYGPWNGGQCQEGIQMPAKPKRK